MDFIAFVQNPQVEKSVRAVIDSHWPRGKIINGGVQAAIATGAPPVMPGYMVVDITGSMNPEADVQKVLSVHADVPALVFVGDKNDVNLYRTIVKSGYCDYLVNPISDDDLYNTLINISMSQSQAGHQADAAQGRKAKMITMLGVHGGVGTTSLAVNTSWILAEEHKRNVAIVDLDVHFGTVALSLDIEPSVGFRDALESPGRIDSLFVEGSLVAATDRLSVLAAEENLDSFVSYNNTALELLFEKLRENRHFLILDTPRTLMMRFPGIIEDADHVVVVSELTVPALRDTVTIVNKIHQIVPGKAIKVVINRDRNKKVGQISLNDFEREIEMSVAAILPDAPDTAGIAINDGKPMCVVNSSSRIVQDLRNFCKLLDGAPPAEKKKSGIQKILHNLK